MYEDNDIYESIVDMINKNYLKTSEIKLRINKSGYNSIIVKSEKSAYRYIDSSELLFARVNTSAKIPYISFSSKYSKLFESNGISFYSTKSEPGFIRLDIKIFSPLSAEHQKLPNIINKIFIELFSFTAFGCCSKYVQCSDKKQCVHDDLAYATACAYRKNLEQGKIFYGKNKNI